jgi:hypothetical protein
VNPDIVVPYDATTPWLHARTEEHQGCDSRTELMVSPKIGPVDADRVRHAFLEELGRDGGFARLSAEVWRRAGTVQVKRQWPVATKAGKILPFHVIKS